MPRLPVTILACLALAGGGVAGCGSSDDSDGASATPPAAAPPPAAAATGGEVKVSMKNIKFVPQDVTVKVGQKIVWTNDDGNIPHNVTDMGGAFASDNLNGGDTFEYTPKKAGTIDYVCTIHSGQTGKITVTT